MVASSLLEPIEGLAAAARHGQVEAREQLCRRILRIAIHVASGQFGFSVEDAEDVAQDTILRSLKQLESSEINVSWVHRAATHRCLDLLRRQRTAASAGGVPEADLLGGGAVSSSPPPASEIDLRLAWQRLPSRCKDLLHLYYYEGCTVAELDAARGDGRRRCQFEIKKCLDCLAMLAQRGGRSFQ